MLKFKFFNNQRSIVAPLLINLSQTEDANFEAEDDSMLLPILKKDIIGCFRATILRDCYLVDLVDENIKKILKYNFDEELNDDEFISEKAQISSNKDHLSNNFSFIDLHFSYFQTLYCIFAIEKHMDIGQLPKKMVYIMQLRAFLI